MTRDDALAALAATIALLILAWSAVGCAPAVECYDITVIPPRRVAVVIDKCRGTVDYMPVPPLPEEHADGEASPRWRQPL